MGTLHRFRDYQTATKYRDRPNVYQALVRRMVADEKAGLTTRLALQEAYAQTRKDDPKGAA
jgi:hypothetical protein